MEVILLERIKHLGRLGDKVKVKAGFGRNFLIPKSKAVPANEANIAEFETRRAELEKAEKIVLDAAQQRADKLEGVVIKIVTQTSDEGKLYGSVGTKEIAEAIVAAGHEVEKREVSLPEGVIRSTGVYDVAIQVHTDVSAAVKLHIESEGGEKKPEAVEEIDEAQHFDADDAGQAE